MARTIMKFVNTVSWRNDLPSWRKLKKDAQKLGKELGAAPTASMVKASRRQEKELIASRTKLADKLRKEDAKIREQNKRQAAKDSKTGFQSSIAGLTETSGLKASQTVFAEKMRQEDALAKKQQAGMDSHVKLMRKRNMEQEKFANEQERVIKNFTVSNREIRQMGKLKRDEYINELKQTKNREELLFTVRKIKTEVKDRAREEKLLTKEMNKQTLAQRRLTASTEQMVGALASVYTGVAAVGAVIQTGMEFEKFNKTFLAVSDSAEEAAEHIAFVREEAYRMGTDIIESGLSYSRMLAAVGNKVPLEQVREAFIAIGESATVLGLSQDDTAGAMRAMTQAMGKQKFQAEELRQQMGDRLPVAITAMELAAKDAGLAIDEVGLDKLMEQGKLTMDLLPFFSARLREFANNNNAFAEAARKNYAPALTRMTTVFKDLKNNVFIGLKPALVTMMNSFSEIGRESMNLSKVIGSTLGSALLGLTFPVAITVSAITDLVEIFKELTGVSDESFQEMVRWGFGALGFTVGIIGMYKAIMKLVDGFKLLKKTGEAVKESLGKTGEAASKTAKDTSKFKYQGSWTDVKKTPSTSTLGGRIGGVLGKLSGPLAALTGVMSAGERLGSTEERNQNIVDYITKGKRDFDNVPKKQEVEVKVGIDPATGNLNGYVTGKMDEYMNDVYSSSYNNMSPSN